MLATSLQSIITIPLNTIRQSMIQIEYSSVFTSRLTLAVERTEAALSRGLTAHRQSRYAEEVVRVAHKIFAAETLSAESQALHEDHE